MKVKQIALNGAVYPLTWTSVTNFRAARRPQRRTSTSWPSKASTGFGAVVAGASQTLSSGLYRPDRGPRRRARHQRNHVRAGPGRSAQFIEILNRSELNFDLSGWRLEGVGLTFPPGSIVTNGQILVLAQNRVAFRNAYGSVPVFAVFGGSLQLSGTDPSTGPARAGGRRHYRRGPV